ncbi:NAD(P)-dependent dehydrogenase (short-subunit alcohol dehydrogenase family) [Dyadobacter jejuensis]|uniref:NAD(P)-dependent dehydrogenase (Short-subunit alcohol dehydrogenase family) n=1 Tax=Dyadobacter jejuensis TaxID=1082580 RepID=A0A316A9F0_9BACT|nr:3-ketoacyl-ACP reductase [Dyadobacter jejuensis]PWJ54546.1 NAD(P)-dependent dehydrogenase (short-subunit alcohol dehydrogenase family) [Dyadobacter jejuensis]
MSKKTALITGGTRGIGFGIAKAMAKENYDLAINGVRPEENAQEALEELRSLGAKVVYCQGNIAISEDRAQIIETAYQGLSKLNVLVNNAGIAPRQRLDLLDTTPENYREVLSTNLEGPFFLTQAIAKRMAADKQNDADLTASIVFVTSVSATVTSINRGEYCVSKAGLAMTTQLFAVRMADFGIPVYEIRPGVITTDMTSKVQEKYDGMFANGMALQPRWGTPDDVGKAVASLTRGDFPYSTGQVIMVDGGMLIDRL